MGDSLAEIEALHVEGDTFNGTVFCECGSDWPCDAAVLAAELQEARAEILRVTGLAAEDFRSLSAIRERAETERKCWHPDDEVGGQVHRSIDRILGDAAVPSPEPVKATDHPSAESLERLRNEPRGEPTKVIRPAPSVEGSETPPAYDLDRSAEHDRVANGLPTQRDRDGRELETAAHLGVAAGDARPAVPRVPDHPWWCDALVSRHTRPCDCGVARPSGVPAEQETPK